MHELNDAIKAQPKVFDPEVIDGLAVAFGKAWTIVEAAGHVGGQILDARSILAQRIIQRASQGEHDPTVLCADAVSYWDTIVNPR
jgi:hypothetical protein